MVGNFISMLNTEYNYISSIRLLRSFSMYYYGRVSVICKLLVVR